MWYVITVKKEVTMQVIVSSQWTISIIFVYLWSHNKKKRTFHWNLNVNKTKNENKKQVKSSD